MIIHYNCTIGSILLDSFLLIHHPYPPSFHEMIFILVRDSAAAVHEAAATLGFTLKKEQEKVIVAFTQGHDVFVALPTGFGKSLCCCCLPYVFDKLRDFTCIYQVFSSREPNVRDNFPIYIYGLIERHLRFFPGALIIITLRGKTHLAGCCDQSQDVRSCKEKSNAVHVTPRI